MLSGPLLGVLLHAVGEFAADSFYAPLKKVERWAWESSWLVMGLAPTHHAAMGVGHNTTDLRRVATLIGIPLHTISC